MAKNKDLTYVQNHKKNGYIKSYRRHGGNVKQKHLPKNEFIDGGVNIEAAIAEKELTTDKYILDTSKIMEQISSQQKVDMRQRWLTSIVTILGCALVTYVVIALTK